MKESPAYVGYWQHRTKQAEAELAMLRSEMPMDMSDIEHSAEAARSEAQRIMELISMVQHFREAHPDGPRVCIDVVLRVDNGERRSK